MRDTLSARRGFTLTEALVVLAILGIALAIGIPSLNHYLVRSRLIGTVRDVELTCATARLKAVNGRSQAVVVFHAAGAGDEFATSPFAGRNTVVAFLDRNPANDADSNNGNGRWDPASSEPIITSYSVRSGITFKAPGGGAAVTNGTWQLGGVTTNDRVVYTATGSLAANTSGADPAVCFGDNPGNFIRLRFNHISGQTSREKNVPGTSQWLGDVVRGRWAWVY